MTWQPDYTDTATLSAYLLPQGQTANAVDLANMAIAITAASRCIDKAANRQFGLTGSAVARYYTNERVYIEGRPAIIVDDLQTSVGLTVQLDTGTEGTYSTTLVLGTDFDLWPRNAAANGLPWTHIVLRRTPSASSYFPRWGGGIKVTANWGWSTIPTVIKQAVMIQAGRFFVRKDSLYGVAGSPDSGTEVRLLAKLDPDVAITVSTLKRRWGVIK